MENRNLLKIALLVAITNCLFSCGNLDNPKERNKLVFVNSITSVTDSVNALNLILLNTRKQNYIYAIDSNYLYIEIDKQTSIKVGLLSDNQLFESTFLEFIEDVSDRKHFISLVAYLNKNYLSRCDIENGKPVYMYRDKIYMADRQTDLFRFVVFVNSEQEINLKRYKILDSHKNLYLLANTEAKIWSSK